MKAGKIYWALLIAVLGGLSACEIKTDVKLEDADPRIVIEGWVTDAPGPYLVRVTRSTPFTGNPQEDNVAGATVIMSDDMGTVDTLTEIRPGHYETGHLQGQKEHDYTLTVIAEGKTYTAHNRLPRINDLISTGYFYSDTIVFGPGYYVGLLAPEAPGIGDFYQFRIYRNDSLFNSPFDLIISDDRLVDGQVSPFLYPYPHELGDTVVVEVRAISNLTYDYYITFSQQTVGGGGPFGSPPENLLTNFDNDGVGFFGAAAVVRDTVVIQ